MKVNGIKIKRVIYSGYFQQAERCGCVYVCVVYTKKKRGGRESTKRKFLLMDDVISNCTACIGMRLHLLQLYISSFFFFVFYPTNCVACNWLLGWELGTHFLSSWEVEDADAVQVLPSSTIPHRLTWSITWTGSVLVSLSKRHTHAREKEEIHLEEFEHTLITGEYNLQGGIHVRQHDVYFSFHNVFSCCYIKHALLIRFFFSPFRFKKSEGKMGILDEGQRWA